MGERIKGLPHCSFLILNACRWEGKAHGSFCSPGPPHVRLCIRKINKDVSEILDRGLGLRLASRCVPEAATREAPVRSKALPRRPGILSSVWTRGPLGSPCPGPYDAAGALSQPPTFSGDTTFDIVQDFFFISLPRAASANQEQWRNLFLPTAPSAPGPIRCRVFSVTSKTGGCRPLSSRKGSELGSHLRCRGLRAPR